MQPLITAFADKADIDHLALLMRALGASALAGLALRGLSGERAPQVATARHPGRRVATIRDRVPPGALGFGARSRLCASPRPERPVE